MKKTGIPIIPDCKKYIKATNQGIVILNLIIDWFIIGQCRKRCIFYNKWCWKNCIYIFGQNELQAPSNSILKN